jgi:hypothetical protein
VTTENPCKKCENFGWYWLLQQPKNVLKEIFKDIEFNQDDLKLIWKTIRPMFGICENPEPIKEFLQECQQKISNN